MAERVSSMAEKRRGNEGLSMGTPVRVAVARPPEIGTRAALDSAPPAGKGKKVAWRSWRRIRRGGGESPSGNGGEPEVAGFVELAGAYGGGFGPLALTWAYLSGAPR